MEIIQVYQTKNPSYTRNRSISPVGVFVHSTGANNKYLKRYVDAPDRLGKNEYNNHWNQSSATKSVHAWIGYDKNKEVIVANTLPYDRACWGAGSGKKGSYNYDPQAYIQFEICEGSKTDSDYYWKAIAVAEEYCAYLCKLYGWTTKNITSHYEAHAAGYASNHGDPREWMKNFGDSMDKFRERVAARLNERDEPFMSYQAYVKTKSGEGASIWKDNKKSARVKLLADGTTVTVTGNADSKGFVPVTYSGSKGVFDGQYLVKVESSAKDETLYNKLLSIRTMLDEAIAQAK